MPAPASAPGLERDPGRASGPDLLQAVTWPDGYRPACPSCAKPTTGLQEKTARIRGVRYPGAAA